ncbi:MAG TPA: MMPL family transporter [Solirubrobacteraceae bacterium]|jgi:hydrophobe/amphiphile efflux-3 (HAE3) family protein|nr:MMPL family transporter [Solirubrobacteraceae bacterium]
MRVPKLLAAIAGGAARRPALVLAIAGVLGIGGALLALRLQPSAATSSFVSSSSTPYRDTQTFYRHFGEEPVEVLVRGNLQQLVLGSDLGRLAGLEGCLSGKVPRAALKNEGGVGGPCGRLAALGTVKVVFGPGTFLNEAATQIQAKLTGLNKSAEAAGTRAEQSVYSEAIARGLGSAQAHQLGREARQVTAAGYRSQLVSLALDYGLTSAPSLQNKEFISDVVFDSSKPAGTPKQRFAYLFPGRDSALISVRLRPGLSQSQRDRTISEIRAAVRMPEWQLSTAGAGYLVTGEPVIVSDLAKSISSAIAVLLIAALIVMAGTLGLVFSGRPRLLPLALALLAAALTFGALSVAGASLTVASIAVLPVLIGLAVDYGVQFQSRVGESLAATASEGSPAGALTGPIPPPGPARSEAIAAAARTGGPTIAAAAAASAAAMLVLLLSPVPMVRGFGVLLAAGVAVALLCALTAGAAAMSLLPRQRADHPRAPAPAFAAVASAWRGAGELLRENPLTRGVWRFALGPALRHPQRVLGAGLVLAALGWGLDTQTRVETDITKLVPQNLSSLQALNTLERKTGVGGEVAVLVSGRDLATPGTIEWMTSYQRRVLAAFGYSASRGCGRARLCPAFSLPDLFGAQGTAGAQPAKLNASAVDGLLGAIPPYFSQDVITADRRYATLSFGIRLMPLDEQQRVIDRMQASLHPPKGVTAQLVGLPVLAARSGAAVADPWRRLETLLAGLAAVALVLLAAFRGDFRRALVPLVPIALATGWSALVLFVLRIPLNPMSVTLGALVIAISTEFSVLLSERHRQELDAGYDTIEALRRTYRRTGAAVATSGATAIFGFGVLALSDITMLRDFGLVTLIDLTVSLLGVLAALPAALVLAERIGLRERRPLPRPRWRLRPAGRRARSGHGRA